MRGLLLNKNIFFSKGVQKIVSRRTKCVEKEGDYLEKNDALVSFVLQLYSFKKYITDTF
jgi:hypothetical protein